MSQISVVSNVTNERVGFNDEDVPFLRDFYLSRASPEVSIFELHKSDMFSLKNEIEKFIDERLALREGIEKSNVKIIYNEREYHLDFRNHNDFIINVMMSVYLMIDFTINLSGIIYVYMPDELLTHNKSDLVLSFIRGKYSVSANKLPQELIYLYNDNPHVENLDTDTIKIAIDYLERLGLIYYDRILNEYSVTAKGYNLW